MKLFLQRPRPSEPAETSSPRARATNIGNLQRTVKRAGARVGILESGDAAAISFTRAKDDKPKLAARGGRHVLGD